MALKENAFATFHLERSALKLLHSYNISLKLVAFATSISKDLS
jgi:hypothetical protein